MRQQQLNLALANLGVCVPWAAEWTQRCSHLRWDPPAADNSQCSDNDNIWREGEPGKGDGDGWGSQPRGSGTARTQGPVLPPADTQEVAWMSRAKRWKEKGTAGTMMNWIQIFKYHISQLKSCIRPADVQRDTQAQLCGGGHPMGIVHHQPFFLCFCSLRVKCRL